MVGLQQTYPHLFEICPLIMRTQGILLVKDAVLTTALCSTDGRLFHLIVDLADPPPPLLCYRGEIRSMETSM